MEAISLVNTLLEATKAIEAALDILIPFWQGSETLRNDLRTI